MTSVHAALQAARDAAAAARRSLVDLEIDTVLSALREAPPTACNIYFWATHPTVIGLYASSAPAYDVRVGDPYRTETDRPLLHRALRDVELCYVGDGSNISGGAIHGACVLFSVLNAYGSRSSFATGEVATWAPEGLRALGLSQHWATALTAYADTAQCAAAASYENLLDAARATALAQRQHVMRMRAAVEMLSLEERS